MPSNLKIAQAAASQEANALVGAFTDDALLKIYDGTQPATPETAITTQNLLATVTLASPAFGAAADGVISANAIANVTVAASGTAAWFRLFKSDGSTAIMDGSVGTSGCDLNLDSTALAAGATFAVTSFTFTVPSA
ncbi:MAG TPA: hypothetical protein VMV79_04755 [Alphaproteobacteria bacterium]|nr:hypothetical protein [Alphaproteobacteria bacterium]